MTTRAKRLALAVALIVAVVIAMIGAAAVGAASSASPLSDIPAVQPFDPPAEPPETTPPVPKRFSAIGVIVGIREQRLAVRVKGRELPVLVAIRPATALRLNRQPAALSDFHVGDRVVVVGRPGPRGNVMVAFGVNVVRATTPST
jgi:hypothetical protein